MAKRIKDTEDLRVNRWNGACVYIRLKGRVKNKQVWGKPTDEGYFEKLGRALCIALDENDYRKKYERR